MILDVSAMVLPASSVMTAAERVMMNIVVRLTVHRFRVPKPYTLNPKPQTLNSNPQTLNPKPYALNLKPQTLNPQPQALNPKP